MARLFADENFPLAIVRGLRELGHDVLTTPEAGLAGQATRDEFILMAATRLGRGVLTHNRRHSRHLHERSSDHAGIVICTENPNREELARRFDEKLITNSVIRGRLLRVTRP